MRVPIPSPPAIARGELRSDKNQRKTGRSFSRKLRLFLLGRRSSGTVDSSVQGLPVAAHHFYGYLFTMTQMVSGKFANCCLAARATNLHINAGNVVHFRRRAHYDYYYKESICFLFDGRQILWRDFLRGDNLSHILNSTNCRAAPNPCIKHSFPMPQEKNLMFRGDPTKSE